MVASIIMIALALAWLMYETDFMRVRLESYEYQRAQLELAKTPETATDNDMPAPQAVKILAADKPVLMLNAGNPDNYPMTLKTTTKELKALLDQLSKTDLILTEEVWGYDYSNQT